MNYTLLRERLCFYINWYARMDHTTQSAPIGVCVFKAMKETDKALKEIDKCICRHYGPYGNYAQTL